MEHSVSSVPSAPELPSVLWWVVAIAASGGFTALYRSVATNRAQRIMAIAGPLVGVVAAILFGAAYKLHLGQLLPMYGCTVAAMWLAGVGHSKELREMWRISAEEGNENVRISPLLTLQFTASLLILCGLGIWFAASA
ncbi:hypothetical protein KBZ10_12270 [Streptomyces sp. F63]|uniref:hypothetical protein n=1 Tax=Streptomyces sp. F63 TaxID=2824887 RepID=UPI001B38A60A|nr:hypothetical protein [Streptomyces sp. F63]MBQ0985279.1 hypothetical protein [Streptomyces sp. F63]